MDDKPDNHPSAISTFRRREKPKSVKGVIRRRRRYLKVEHKDNHEEGGGGGDEDEVDEEEVEKKIVELQRIVPGGELFGIENLFEQTASYILALQCQLEAMNAVASFFEGLEMEKTKLGG